MALVQIGNENGAPVELYDEDHGSGSPAVLIYGLELSDRAGSIRIRWP